MKINNKFEFLLQYGSSKLKYNRWKQTKNPLEQTEEGVTEADGFESIHLDYNEKVNFHGLAKTTIPISDENVNNYIPSLINGIFNHRYWNYAIGQYKSYEPCCIDYIPGETGESSVDLWIRVLPSFYKIYQSLFKKLHFFHIKIYVFIFIFS